MLHSYENLFGSESENSALDKAEKRFQWLKSTLKEYNQKYEDCFPPEWEFLPNIAYEFCKMTK